MSRPLRFLGIGVAALLAALGCGGNSGEGGQGAEAGEGGAPTGGTGGTSAGGTSAGGTSTGGSSGSGGGSNLRSCEVPSDCVVVGASCCVCGVPELGDVTAVNVESAAEFTQSLCSMGPACGCPTALNPNLVATCNTGTCQAVDVREHAVSACGDDSECRVRVSQCCECGGDTSPGSLIAVGLVGYDVLVCDPLGLCTDCAPDYPSEASAICEAGHCTLVDERL